ncbi:hypothetical protein RBSWK_02320 [Rhodopirellula baltica SWK14]|uniref:Uncharacterized protein n=1 Tax=Rhodopirellula baltica SWK14 TaxID=993516 RepID=L7CHN1_RHOBT|nr:hypothetical protein RBSWK_02320 [Rhodopirellula baltica SWK14]
MHQVPCGLQRRSKKQRVDRSTNQASDPNYAPIAKLIRNQSGAETHARTNQKPKESYRPA